MIIVNFGFYLRIFVFRLQENFRKEKERSERTIVHRDCYKNNMDKFD